jgi:hypothetical protein
MTCSGPTSCPAHAPAQLPLPHTPKSTACKAAHTISYTQPMLPTDPVSTSVSPHLHPHTLHLDSGGTRRAPAHTPMHLGVAQAPLLLLMLAAVQRACCRSCLLLGAGSAVLATAAAGADHCCGSCRCCSVSAAWRQGVACPVALGTAWWVPVLVLI